MRASLKAKVEFSESNFLRNSITKLGDPSKGIGVFLVAMRLGDTPVPIPNTMVKT